MAEILNYRVKVTGDKITVKMPGTSFRAAFSRRGAGIERVALKGSDLSAPITLREFALRADELANEKARELGWIV
jgi:hypothetical protein